MHTEFLVIRPERERPFGRLMRKLGYNIEMHLKEVEWEGVDWIQLAQDGDQWRDVVNMLCGMERISGSFLKL
jgi:hypothetical protein